MNHYHQRRDQLLDEYYRLIGKGNMKTASLIMADLFLLLSEQIEANVSPSPKPDLSNGKPYLDEPSYSLAAFYNPQPRECVPEPIPVKAEQLNLFETGSVVQDDEPRDKLGRRRGVPGIVRPHIRTTRGK